MWGRTVDYEDAALLPAACGPVQYETQGQMVYRVALSILKLSVDQVWREI